MVGEEVSRRATLVKLHQLLDESFGQSDLKELALSLGFDDENLGGEHKRAKLFSLIQEVDRHKRLDELLATARLLRPRVEWPDVPAAPNEPSLILEEQPAAGDMVAGDKNEVRFEGGDFRNASITINQGRSEKAKRGKLFWPVLIAMVVIFIGGTGGAGLYAATRIRPMEPGFNVAIAPFTMEDERGRLVVTEVSEGASEWLYEEMLLNKDKDDLWDDIRGPADVEPVELLDEGGRRQEISDLLEKHNAAVLIYGTVVRAGEGYSLTLEFAVSDDDFRYGSEVAGPDRLGSLTDFEHPLIVGERTPANDALYGRVEVLEYLLEGLFAFHREEYDVAAATFRRAAMLPQSEWAQNEGKEVAYLLVGAAELLEYEKTLQPHWLDDAWNDFWKAYEIKQDYARAHLGLANVLFMRAQVIDVETRTITAVYPTELGQAAGYFSQTLRFAGESPLAYERAKAFLGLGQVNLLGAERGVPGWTVEEAQANFEEAITIYEGNGEPVELAWLAAQAHAGLGRAAGVLGDWATTVDEGKVAIGILEDLADEAGYRWIAVYWGYVGVGYDCLNQADDAAFAYGEAIRIGSPNWAYPEEIEKWELLLENVAVEKKCNEEESVGFG